MTDMTTTYPELINEAFIKPIRNVTVIDDEYPTLISLIESQGQAIVGDAETIALRNANTERLKKIINMCHSDYKWSIDVFNGESPNFGGEADIPPHIHHSDLIVLDYHLDGDASADNGARARKILQSLDRNNHYNITLVHTKGYEDDIKDVFIEVLTDFMRVDSSHILIPLDDKVDEMNIWLDSHDDGSDYQWINSDINLLEVLKIYCSATPDKCINPNKPEHPLHAFVSEINDVARESGLDCVDLMKCRFHDILKQNEIVFEKNARDDLRWYWGNDTNFISTGKTFISVIRKSADSPKDELIGALNIALTKHNASPMHLLMAKMRYEMDENGIEQASRIISNKYAQAGWLYNLLKNAGDDSAHDKAINLHWEQLATASRLVLRDFSKKIMAVAENDCPANEKGFVQKFFKECMGDKNLAVGHLNAFSCSLPVSNDHLITGTVLDIEGEIWVCITPACDLVPKQKITQWQSRIGGAHKVFKAVKFDSAKLSTANSHANCNEYIYLNIDGTPKAYWLGNDNPTWDTFYAGNLGRYGDGHTVTLTAVREDATVDGNPLTIRSLAANAVAELRYEYALNLLHKFGSSQTRVGLDFQEQNSMWA
ncbi:response regulator receiver domain [Dickeya chrysanthemi]|uniref:response regulator receiver domain n=1 Tax=Dickeya chrysanthemi TaxID=556 RepID=UPI00301967E6